MASGGHLSIWPAIEVCVSAMFVSAVVLRVWPQTTGHNVKYVKTIYALALVLQYISLMHSFYMFKMLGPKIIMIHKMLKDVLFFIMLFSIFLFSFGVAIQSLVYPHNEFSFTILYEALHSPFFDMLGESGLHCTNNQTVAELDAEIPMCPQQNVFAPLLFGVYMVLTNVLLLNLLVAMFSYSFTQVQDHWEKIWRFQRYEIIKAYEDTPALPPPLRIFNIFYRLVKFVWHRATTKCGQQRHRTNAFIAKRCKNQCKTCADEDNQLSHFEAWCRNSVLLIGDGGDAQTVEAKNGDIVARLTRLTEDVESIKEKLCASDSVEKPKINSANNNDRSLSTTLPINNLWQGSSFISDRRLQQRTIKTHQSTQTTNERIETTI